MNLNFFQIAVLIIVIGIIILCWKKIRYISNFFLGGLILIILSSFNFWGFSGKLDALSGFFLTIGYCFINLTYIIFIIKKEAKTPLIFAILFFIMFSVICLFFVDYGKYFEHKFGMILRLFLSFFPLYVFTYFKEFRTDKKIFK